MIVETVKNNINRPLTSIWQFAPAIDIIQISHETYRSKMFIHDESVTFQLPLSQYLK
jgi:urease accessory protein